MSTQTLAEYIEEIRQRHPRLSRRRMAMEAGISESLISGMVTRGLGARPETLKAIADRWGREGDYEEMMRLAGHPVSEAPRLSPAERTVLETFNGIEPEAREKLLRMIRQVPSLDAVIASAYATLSGDAELQEFLEIYNSLPPHLQHVLNIQARALWEEQQRGRGGDETDFATSSI